MPEVCDYSIIINQRQDMRDSKKFDLASLPVFKFNTGGRERSDALLFITIQGPDRDVGLKINKSIVGILAKNPNATAPHTQIVRLPGTVLKRNGENEFEFDDIGFIVESVVCFFKQNA